jgi:hypothetical protein
MFKKQTKEQRKEAEKEAEMMLEDTKELLHQLYNIEGSQSYLRPRLLKRYKKINSKNMEEIYRQTSVDYQMVDMTVEQIQLFDDFETKVTKNYDFYKWYGVAFVPMIF